MPALLLLLRLLLKERALQVLRVLLVLGGVLVLVLS